MPVALIVYANKSHTDIHGALSLMPIIFILTLFNCAARCNSRFWRPFGYLPNYGYGKGTADKTVTRDKIQDEHNCISFAFHYCLLGLLIYDTTCFGDYVSLVTFVGSSALLPGA